MAVIIPSIASLAAIALGARFLGVQVRASHRSAFAIEARGRTARTDRAGYRRDRDRS
jgi:hypothetical protein